MLPQPPVEFHAKGYVNGAPVKWARIRKEAGSFGTTSRSGMDPLRQQAIKLSSGPDVLKNEPVDQPTLLPVVAFYGTGRLWNEKRFTRIQRRTATNTTRTSAYLDCLSSSSSYRSFSTWYRITAEAVRDPKYRSLGRNDRPENHLTAVRNAVSAVLKPTGWSTIDWQFPVFAPGGPLIERGYVTVEHQVTGRLPLSHLSDGVRNMVALVADLAHRCVRLNPHLGEAAAHETPGILMIDEVDMHLHPQWQQMVIELLQTTFPKIQIIVTTHSPHVLSTVNSDSIRVVEINSDGIGRTDSELSQTRGDESGNVLARVMNVNPVPDIAPARVLSVYRGLVQNGLDETEKAKRIWRYLVSSFGEGHHLLEEAAVLRDLQVFKREHKLPPGGPA